MAGGSACSTEVQMRAGPITLWVARAVARAHSRRI